MQLEHLAEQHQTSHRGEDRVDAHEDAEQARRHRRRPAGRRDQAEAQPDEVAGRPRQDQHVDAAGGRARGEEVPPDAAPRERHRQRTEGHHWDQVIRRSGGRATGSRTAAATSCRTATTPAGPTAGKACAPVAGPTWLLRALASMVATPLRNVGVVPVMRPASGSGHHGGNA